MRRANVKIDMIGSKHPIVISDETDFLVQNDRKYKHDASLYFPKQLESCSGTPRTLLPTLLQPWHLAAHTLRVSNPLRSRSIQEGCMCVESRRRKAPETKILSRQSSRCTLDRCGLTQCFDQRMALQVFHVGGSSRQLPGFKLCLFASEIHTSIGHSLCCVVACRPFCHLRRYLQEY
jgi:hypothetical protein